MNLSIRTRLTLWYVILLIVSLAAFGTVFTYSYFKLSLSRIDNQISSVANLMPHTVMSPTGRLLLPRNFDVILERFFGVRTSGNFIQILDSHGAVVAKSSNLKDFSLPLSKETYIAAHSALTTYEVARSKGGGLKVRLVSKPIILRDKGLAAIIQVGSSLDEVEEMLRSLVYIFSIGILVSIVVAAAIGWFLADKALAPVAGITRKARSIGAENLDERIPIAGPMDEIGSLAATINEMIERLEQSFRRTTQFTADASHELKTPLTVLKGEMEMALRSGDDLEYMKEVIASSLEEIDRMSLIVRNLLDLARIDVEKGAARDVEVAVDCVFSESFELMRRIALDRGVELDILRNDPAKVCGDPVRVGQLFYNLIDNAIKYTPSGGRVELSCEVDGTSVVAKVRDTGIGIAAEDLPSLFDRFYRVSEARTREAGNGQPCIHSPYQNSPSQEITQQVP